jgi:uncharacterized protein (TIRG00374 family)
LILDTQLLLNKSILSILKYIIILSIGVALLFLAFRGVKLKDTVDEMLKADLFWLSVSIATSLVAFISRAIRWNMLIEPLGYKPSLGNTSAALMIGYLANLAIPRLGEVTRCGTLNQSEKVPFDSLLGTVIVERILDVLCLLTCIFMVALTEYERLGSFLNQNIFDPASRKITSAVNSPLLIIITTSVLILLVFLVLKRRSKTNTFTAKIRGLLKGIINGLDTFRRLKNPFAFLFHTILIWTMYFLMSYTCFFALPATSGLDWHAGLFVLVVGGLGMSAPVQGGIGAYHLLVSQGLLLYGLTHDHGLAFATLMHTSQTLVVILLGALSFIYISIQRKNAKSNYA